MPMGVITEVHGPVVVVECSTLPPIHQALSAANDGRTIFYAPPFDALLLPRQIGLVAHQVLHIAIEVIGQLCHRDKKA